MKSNLIDTTHLPNNVVAVLQQGNKLEAVKLLCDATGLGMLDAKAAIELHLQSNPTPWSARAATERLPAEVMQALLGGDKRQATQLLRAVRNIGLQEAKDQIERYQSHALDNTPYGAPDAINIPTQDAPGKTSGLLVWKVVLAMVAIDCLAYVGYLLFGQSK
jgi:ribosomal protein L7/L12